MQEEVDKEKPIKSEESEKDHSILYSNFNQEGTCFSLGTEKGFKILNCYPFKDGCSRDLGGGIRIVEMLGRSNILALVGGGKNPKYPANKVIIWDEQKGKEVSEISFSSNVINIKLTKERVFVVCERKLFVFDINSLEPIDIFETYYNNKGLFSLSLKGDIIAYPEKNKIGCVKMKNFGNNKEYIVLAHKTCLSYIKLNNKGNRLATASLKGTLIRIYDTDTSQLIQELRRGAESAEIYCISFDKTGKYLAVSSDRKTVHIFFINSEESGVNRQSVFGGVANFFGVGKHYFNSEWSFAKFKINSPKSICCFGPENTIIVVTYDGKYYQASFDSSTGGECVKIQEKDII